MTTDPHEQRVWEKGWDGHRDAQARRLAALSLAEKLDWLEEAHARVMHIQGGADAVRERPAAPGTTEQDRRRRD